MSCCSRRLRSAGFRRNASDHTGVSTSTIMRGGADSSWDGGLCSAAVRSCSRRMYYTLLCVMKRASTVHCAKLESTPQTVRRGLGSPRLLQNCRPPHDGPANDGSTKDSSTNDRLLNQRPIPRSFIGWNHHRRRHPVARLNIQQPHSLRRPARFPDELRFNPNDLSVL